MKRKPRNRDYLRYILNPIELLSTKKVVHVNPTISAERDENINSVVTLYEYDASSLKVHTVRDQGKTFPFIAPEKNAWINVDGLKKEEVENICNRYQIHPLLIEDILSMGQRPKMDEINGILYCVLNMIFFNDVTHSIETEQVSLVLGQNFVISFQEDPKRDVFTPVRERLKLEGSKVRTYSVDFLFYVLLDSIVDNYFLVTENMADRIEITEEEIIRHTDRISLAQINILRKEMILFKRNIAPVREMLSGILRSDTDLIEEKNEKYFKDIYDHVIQANDLTDNYRDMMMNLQDLYLSNVNLKMNEVMKVMAIVTCLLAPATVIGGIFGMNFERIPLLHDNAGFYISVGVMLIIPIAMMIIFKRRGWF